MKNRMIKYISVLVLGFVLGGCNLLTDDPNVLIIDRISNFKNTLNNGAYSDMQKHFHPEMPSYDSYADPTVLNSGLFSSANAPFDFSVPVITDGSGDDKNATGSFSHNNTSDSGTYVAIMRQNGDDWKIYDMVITIGSTSLIIRTLE